MPYRVQFRSSARRQLRRLPTQIAEGIVQAAEALADEPRPRGAIKMKGPGDRYRIRVGDYRVVYEVEDRELIVVAIDIGHRSDIYR